MLRQILRDLWVDPELLAELDEAQRHALFCRMRAEQVRRWSERESQRPPPPPAQRAAPRPDAKHVDWLLGADGEPWVWVMGEHSDDLSIEDILEREQNDNLEEEALNTQDEGDSPQLQLEQQQSQEPLTKQHQEIQHSEKEEMSNGHSHEVEESIYCTVDELRVAIENGDASPEKRGALQEISLNTPERPEKVAQRVALWERRVADERGVQRPQRRRREISTRQAEEQRLQQEEEDRAWREQERKAKEAEQQIREIARRAREEHRRTSVLAMEVEPSLISASCDSSNSLANALGSATPTAKPPSTEAVVQWFRSSEIARKAGLAPGTNLVATWFHGLISRQEAELRLESAPVGSFLVRVSERVWGYAVSFRAVERCKHFLIDASSGHYQFLGANQLSHGSLGELIEYHARQPITLLGGERLLHPCARTELPSIFQGLLSSSVRR